MHHVSTGYVLLPMLGLGSDGLAGVTTDVSVGCGRLLKAKPVLKNSYAPVAWQPLQCNQMGSVWKYVGASVWGQGGCCAICAWQSVPCSGSSVGALPGNVIAELLGVKELLCNFCVAIFAKQSNDLSGFCLEM